jgi:anti-sigma regulatory factor (Ser/Thr protein kinase)
VRTLSELAGFSDKKEHRIILATEEAFMTTLAGAYEPDETGLIEVYGIIEPHALTVSFCDRGLPFDPATLGEFDPRRLSARDTDLTGIELFFMKEIADQVCWLNHGRDGKELRLAFFRPTPDITEQLPAHDLSPFQPDVPPAPPQNYAIRPVQANEFVQVAQCIYKAYGYSYPNEDMYYPERIATLVESGKLISVVAVDLHGRLAGHYALERFDLGAIVESGQAVISPEHRGRGLMGVMRTRLEAEAMRLGLDGIYSQPVTSHTRSQLVNIKNHSRPFGLSLGLVPQTLNFKRLSVEPLQQRESCLYYYKSLKPVTSKTIYVGAPYRDIVVTIYRQAGMVVSVLPDETAVPLPENASVNTQFHPSWGFGTVIIKENGDDCAKLVKQGLFHLTMKAGAHMVYLVIPLEEQGYSRLLDTARELGFIFSGIAPSALSGKDALRLQFVNCDIDFDRLQIAEDEARLIVDYIRREYQAAALPLCP